MAPGGIEGDDRADGQADRRPLESWTLPPAIGVAIRAGGCFSRPPPKTTMLPLPSSCGVWSRYPALVSPSWRMLLPIRSTSDR